MSPSVTIYNRRVVVRASDGATLLYSVDMDLSQLDRLALQAAVNKRRQAHAGPITVRVTSIRTNGDGGHLS